MTDTPIHAEPHPYAGEVVPLLGRDQSVGDDEARALFRIEDWADRAFGKPWRRHRSPAVLIYSLRAQTLDLPLTDNRVLRGTLLGLPLLIHTSEIDWSRL